ncbi:unnamed protein product [Onchocerca flexuosa]|uniref:SCP domain-containing protein n=1 Tax=Onchocerca flexuosa TaxID=387005 RepID=A0A183HFZ6_9BILA|nr:unnamed protein product [Onchocerca flexuosa]
MSTEEDLVDEYCGWSDLVEAISGVRVSGVPACTVENVPWCWGQGSVDGYGFTDMYL